MKEKLGAVAQYWFWIATALVTLLSVGIWWVSSGKLIAELEKNSSQLDSDAAKITTVRNALGTHPNAVSHREMQRLVEERTSSVMEAWTSVFSRQQDILVWPTAELKQDFVDEFADLIPIELKVPFPTPEEEEKLPALRTRYQNYIGSVLPSIAEIAKAKWTADFDSQRGGMGMGMGMGVGMGMPSDMAGMTGGGEDMYGGGVPGGMGGMGGLPAKDDGALVTWSTSSQEQLLADLFPWRKGPGGPPPSTLDVLYSQENLWILRQLMQIVALVNGDVGQRHQAKIREINRIAIGRSVPKAAGVISKPGSGMAGGMGSGGMMGSMMEGGMPGGMGGAEMDYGAGGMDAAAGMMADMAGMDSSGGGAVEAVTLDPGDNRYVDTAGAPLTAEQLRAALSSQSPTDAFMAVAKRVPVMLSLKIDQRHIPELLAVCGSVPLMVEVKHVRILPPSKAAASVGMGSGSGMGMGAGMGMGMPGDMGGMTGGGEDMYGGGEGMMGSGGMGGMGGGTQPSSDPFPMDLSVEVYGIIYIYNPPSTEALGIEKVDETTVIEGTAMGDGAVAEPAPAEATPAATDPAEATPAVTEPAEAGSAGPPATAPPAAETTPPAPGPTEPPAASGEPAASGGSAATAAPAAEAGAMKRRNGTPLAEVDSGKTPLFVHRNRDAAELASQTLSV